MKQIFKSLHKYGVLSGEKGSACQAILNQAWHNHILNTHSKCITTLCGPNHFDCDPSNVFKLLTRAGIERERKITFIPNKAYHPERKTSVKLTLPKELNFDVRTLEGLYEAVIYFRDKQILKPAEAALVWTIYALLEGEEIKTLEALKEMFGCKKSIQNVFKKAGVRKSKGRYELPPEMKRMHSLSRLRQPKDVCTCGYVKTLDRVG